MVSSHNKIRSHTIIQNIPEMGLHNNDVGYILLKFCVIMCTREIVLIREENFIAKHKVSPVKLQFDGLLGTNIK